MAKAKRALPQGFRMKPNGMLEFRFTTEHGRFSVSGATVGECRKKELEKRQKLAGGYIRDSKVTIEQYFNEFMDRKEGTVRASTLRSERGAFGVVLREIGSVRVAELERRRVVALQKKLGAEYYSSTANARISMLRALMRSAVLDKIRPDNPCDGLKALRRTEAPARNTYHRALTLEEQAAFFEAARGEWLYELFCFLVQTGCRHGEARALLWSDIDQKKGVIHIRRTVTNTNHGMELGDGPKTRAGLRDIPINPGIQETLQKQRRKNEDILGAVPVDGLVFFGQKKEGIVSAEAVSLAMKRAVEKAGIEHVSPHCLRDTFATRAIEQGMTPQTLKTILGHSSLALTMDLYAHVLPDTKAAEMRAITIAL